MSIPPAAPAYPGPAPAGATMSAGRHEAFIDPAARVRSGSAQKTMGFFTDTSVCIGCKACEVACKQWNALPGDGYELTGYSYDNTQWLSGSTWRHVAFIERPGAGHPGTQADWLMSSDVCKHCTNAGCLEACPTGAIVRTEFNTVVIQDDVCNGCGYCVPSCPFGVVALADLPEAGKLQRGEWRLTPQGIQRAGVELEPFNSSAGLLAHKCTLCYDRMVDGVEPACAKACPTDSIQYGEIDELRRRAERRVEDLRARGASEAYLYGAREGDPGATGGIGPLNAFFLLLDRPETYNLPARPRLPQNNVLPGYVATGLTAIALGLGAAFAFARRAGR